MHDSLMSNKSESRREFKLFENALESTRAHESFRLNKNESGQEFKLFESAQESTRVPESLRRAKQERESVDQSLNSLRARVSMRAHESLRPNKSESGRAFKLFENA